LGPSSRSFAGSIPSAGRNSMPGTLMFCVSAFENRQPRILARPPLRSRVAIGGSGHAPHPDAMEVVRAKLPDQSQPVSTEPAADPLCGSSVVPAWTIPTLTPRGVSVRQLEECCQRSRAVERCRGYSEWPKPNMTTQSVTNLLVTWRRRSGRVEGFSDQLTCPRRHNAIRRDARIQAPSTMRLGDPLNCPCTVLVP
jgi:hypothetical protein